MGHPASRGGQIVHIAGVTGSSPVSVTARPRSAMTEDFSWAGRRYQRRPGRRKQFLHNSVDLHCQETYNIRLDLLRKLWEIKVSIGRRSVGKRKFYSEQFCGKEHVDDVYSSLKTKKPVLNAAQGCLEFILIKRLEV